MMLIGDEPQNYPSYITVTLPLTPLIPTATAIPQRRAPLLQDVSCWH